MDWPEPVERVAAFIREAGAEARVEEFAAGTPTVGDAARAVGCAESQIVKSLVVACDGTSLVVLVPGNRRLDTNKIARAVGCSRVAVAGRAQVREATGFEPGAVAPFPLPRVHRVFAERTLLAHDVVWVGAGSPHHLAALAPGELVRLARAQMIDAVED